jgi:hypothetical protein
VTPMSWADPSMYLTYANNPSAGEVVVGDVSGKQFSFREGRGVTSDFLTRQLTDGTVCDCMSIKPTHCCDVCCIAGKPRKNTDEVWIPYKRSAINTVKTKSKRIEGIDVNDFVPDLDIDFSDAAEMENRERTGEKISI